MKRDEQAEWWALGALLEYDAAALLHAHPLMAEVFTSPERSLAFRAIESLANEGRPVTLEAVALRLRWTGGPHLAALMAAGNGVVDGRGWGPERFQAVAEALRERFRRRRLAEHLQGQMNALRADSGDVAGILKASEDFARDMEAGAVEVDRTGADDLRDVIDEWALVGEPGSKPRRIPTGIPLLDAHLGGEQAQDGTMVGGGWEPNINILAGEPGALKSGLAATCAAEELAAGMTVGYVGVEEGTRFIQRRLLAKMMNMRLAAVGSTRLHDYQQERLANAVGQLVEPMRRLLVNSDATNPARLVRTIRRWVVQHGVQVVYVDHLGELDHTQSVRDRYDLAVKNTLKELRPLFRDKGIALVLVAHLNREAQEGRPKKHHLKESGYIEAMGRLVLGCWSHPRWPDRQLIEVLKGNEVETNCTLWLPRLREAALVDSAGGGRIDWQEAEAEEREGRKQQNGSWKAREGGWNR